MPRRVQSSSDGASDSYEVRKRVGKACTRCRLKKCKCDGATPCTRCKSDDAICAYGKHKKSDKIMFRKGYVQMLERQQSQLIAGLQELYRRAQTSEGWTEPPLESSHYGQPLTHKILEGLGVLHTEEWDDGAHEVMSSWHSFERQLEQGSGMNEDDDASVDLSPSNTVTTSPVPDLLQTAFPNSTIMARRTSKLEPPPTSVTQNLDMPTLMAAPQPIKPLGYVSSETSRPIGNHYPQQDVFSQVAPRGLMFNDFDEVIKYDSSDCYGENKNLSFGNFDWTSMSDDMINAQFPISRVPMQVR